VTAEFLHPRHFYEKLDAFSGNISVYLVHISKDFFQLGICSLLRVETTAHQEYKGVGTDLLQSLDSLSAFSGN